MTTTNEKQFIGTRQPRLEDEVLLRGQGRYGDEVPTPPGTLYAAIVRSPHPHARLKAVDSSRALEMDGVHGVLTGEDVRQWALPFPVGVRQPMEHWCLAVDKVRYVGEPVAVVIAENRYLAEDALSGVTVDYETLPVAVDTEFAIESGAAILHEKVGGNVVSDRTFRYGDPETAFAEADRQVSIKVRFPRSSCMPIECYVVLAQFDPANSAFDITSNFQGPYALHSVMCRALQVPANRLRLRTPPESGGSFGIKQGVFPYVVMMGLAARKVGAPVKWVEDRLEHLQGASSGTNRVSTLEAAVTREGRVTALRLDQLDDCGAYLRAPEPATTYRMHGNLTGAYAIRNLAVRNRIVMTNKTPTGLNRGFGGPQVYFPLERLMQRIAVELDLDPLDVIRTNLVPKGAFPYRSAAGSLLDSGDYPAGLEKGVREGGLEELIQRRDEARREGRYYGIGYTAAVEPSISNMGYITMAFTPEERKRAGPKNGAVSTATISVDPLGSVSVHVSSTPQGQGHQTVAAQIVAETLGVPLESISVNVELDTGKDAWSIASGNYSSRFSGAVAGAVYKAALKVRARLAALAAEQWNIDSDDIRFSEGRVYVEGTDQSSSFHRLAGATHWSPGTTPQSEPGGLRETAFWTPPELEAPGDDELINSSLCYGFIFDYCGVEIDAITGAVRIDRYVTLHDAGRMLNPQLVDGQIRGGFAQALGAALMEEFVYGADGNFQSGTLADYLIPTSVEVPEPVILHMETPSPFTPLGAKGVGEGNNMSTPVCIANAVADALETRDVELPLTPSKVRILMGIEEPPRPEGVGEPETEATASSGSRLRARDSVELPGTPNEVFDALLNPQTLAAIIPGCHGLEMTGENEYRADVTVGVGMIRARFDARVSLHDLNPPDSLQLRGYGSSAMGSAEAFATVTLTALEGNRTRLDYDYEATVGGRIASVGGRMLQSASKMIIGQVFSRFSRRMGGGTSRFLFLQRLWQRIRALLTGKGGPS
ncbi:molybdopterin cofactor-binding domain-containing protein [Marinobacter sp.]|uniref:xanthine dehydrogenase family protein molybdopterin-binding subunit n=1 Tax=Marinobacter sp. TaxID=50741 RepID=UPI000C4B3452|nr:molybdopterin cofactor-binding domain-containing protein [Marinobacter sp.]MBP55901.1 carbon monoxide dehydrogenase [Marinobacter sp.]|tara:strand:+ start:2039 stop:5023 length:2985 start_codon:yes stop_codon:yes gene_type:complete